MQSSGKPPLDGEQGLQDIYVNYMYVGHQDNSSYLHSTEMCPGICILILEFKEGPTSSGNMSRKDGNQE